MRRLHDAMKNRKDVALLVVYQREPHVGRMAFVDLEQPATFAARIVLARRANQEFELEIPTLVDSMDDRSRALFGDLPAPVFVISAEGRIEDKYPWVDPETLAPALSKVLEDRTKAECSDALARGEKALAMGQTDLAETCFAEILDSSKIEAKGLERARAAIGRAIAWKGACDGARRDGIVAAISAAQTAYANAPERLVAALTRLAIETDCRESLIAWKAAVSANGPMKDSRARTFLLQRARAAAESAGEDALAESLCKELQAIHDG